MKVQTLTPSFRRALPPVSIRQEGPSQPPPSPEPEGPPSVLKSALLGAGYGALVGAGTALLYQHQPLMTATNRTSRSGRRLPYGEAMDTWGQSSHSRLPGFQSKPASRRSPSACPNRSTTAWQR